MANKQITKSYLEYLGVVDVSTDGKVFTKNGELKPCAMGHGDRLYIRLHDSEKYKATPKARRVCSSGQVRIQVYKVVFAWFNSEVPYGKEIHHKDGDYLNNAIDNLIALTPKEHRAIHAANRELRSTREIKCRLDIPRTWYEAKLKELEARPETDGKQSAVYAMRAKLRYYDSHIEEAQNVIEFKKDCMELSYWKQVFKENNNKKLWHECCTIEKIVKEKKEEAWPVVQHALDVIHGTFGGK